MFIFTNFISVIIIIGILTRISNYFFYKKYKKMYIYLSFLSTLIFILPLIAFFVGFDVVVSEYLLSLILWFLFDIVRKGGK